MTTLTPDESLASSRLPAQFTAMVAHHAELSGQLHQRVALLESAVMTGDSFTAEHAVVTEFLTGEVLPHALAEEDVVYRAAARLAALGPLVAGMTMEHETLDSLAAQFAKSANGVLAASAASAFVALFDVHVRKENELLLPALATAGTNPAVLLAEMEKAFETHRDSARQAAAADRAASDLVVDTRVYTAGSCVDLTTQTLDSLAEGASFVLVSDHDPRGLRYMLDAERPGTVAWQTIENGPSRWQSRIRKVAASG